MEVRDGLDANRDKEDTSTIDDDIADDDHHGDDHGEVTWSENLRSVPTVTAKLARGRHVTWN